MNKRTQEVFDSIKTLDEFERQALQYALLEHGITNFFKLAETYVSVLEADRMKKFASISSLALMLGLYAMTDNSPQGKTARRHLYESGCYTEKDGSGFGKKLFEEFHDEK